MVKKETYSLIRRFLWSGTHSVRRDINPMNWKKVCKLKEPGGLGIINLWDFNTVLLLKWW